MSIISKWTKNEGSAYWIQTAWDHDGVALAFVSADGLLSINDARTTCESIDAAKRVAEIRLQRIADQRRSPKQYPSDEQPRSRNVIGELTTDLKAFIREHRNTFFWIAFAFLADHFFFNGAFRARLNAMVEKMLGKLEKRVDGIHHA